MEWKQYWILWKGNRYGLQLINNWFFYNREEWHLISFYRKYLNGNYDYYFGFLGFQLRFINYDN